MATFEAYDSLDKINIHIRSIRVVAWLMIGWADDDRSADLLEQKDIGDIGYLMGHLADEMKEIAIKLESQVDELKDHAHA